MDKVRRYWRESVVLALIILNLSVWSLVYAERPTDILKVYFLDVGQGDAIFVESPSRKRILIDGGPNNKVLSELGDILPFGDKRIDVVLATHPDTDHITGLVEVVRRYGVGIFIDPGVSSENDTDDILYEALEERGVRKILARRGVRLDLGGGAELAIVFPEGEVGHLDTNDASVVGRLVYGDKSFLFTGDSTKRTEYLLLNTAKDFLDSDVLQVGHHGSDTSTSPLFVEAVSPEIAVISAGKNNRYGHPHANVLDALSSSSIEIFKTYESGTIRLETDGETLWTK